MNPFQIQAEFTRHVMALAGDAVQTATDVWMSAGQRALGALGNDHPLAPQSFSWLPYFWSPQAWQPSLWQSMSWSSPNLSWSPSSWPPLAWPAWFQGVGASPSTWWPWPSIPSALMCASASVAPTMAFPWSPWALPTPLQPSLMTVGWPFYLGGSHATWPYTVGYQAQNPGIAFAEQAAAVYRSATGFAVAVLQQPSTMPSTETRSCAWPTPVHGASQISNWTH